MSSVAILWEPGGVRERGFEGRGAKGGKRNGDIYFLSMR